jgi:hypothetical protein
MASKTGFGSLGDKLMTRSTSEVASSRASDSCSPRVSRSTGVSGWVTEELRLWRTAFTVFALRLRALANLPPALERRLIAFPKAQDKAL